MSADVLNANRSQPKGLYLCFITEMWERFSYYSIRGLFVLYLTKILAFTKPEATNLYGTFTGLIYLSPLIGGYIADRYWGKNASIIFGGILMAIGQFIMGFGGVGWVYAAMGFIIMGNGFFKPNISSLLGDLYEKNDPRRDGGFTIFYMGINLGAFIANLVAGTIGEKIGFMYGFWCAAVGIIIGVAVFIWGKDKYLQGFGKAPKNVSKEDWKEGALTAAILVVFAFIVWLTSFLFAVAAVACAAGLLILKDKFSAKSAARPKKESALTPEEKQKIAVIFIMAFFAIFFFAVFEQKGAALNLFADEYINRVFSIGPWSWEIPTTWFQSFNPLFIILFAPVFSKLWLDLAKRSKEPTAMGKFMIAFWLIAAGYVVLLAASMMLGPGVKMGMIWLILAYFFFTIGEICLSPIGLSLVTKLAPLKFVSIAMSVWFLANAAASKLAGFYSGYIASWPLPKFFMWLMVAPLVASVLLGLSKKKIEKWMHGVK